MDKLVTKELLVAWVQKDPVTTIGRALAALFQYQEAREQAGNVTMLRNGVGFTQSDARIGSLGAKYYLKHRKLEDWHIKLWMKPNKHGQPKIVKYAAQLNSIALRKITEM